MKNNLHIMPDCKSKEIASVCKTLDEYQNRMLTTVIVYPSRHSLNRILAFQSIASLEQKKKFDNVIWDTSVQKYESQDGENESVEKGV